jgi:hypothetical protein
MCKTQVTGREDSMKIHLQAAPTAAARTAGIAVLLFAMSAITCVGCNRSSNSGGGDKANSSDQPNTVGLGDEVTTDPTFDLTLTIDGKPVHFQSHVLTIYESRKPRAGESGYVPDPQGFELEADDVVIAGALPAGVKVAPGQQFQQLVGKSLQVRRQGGDPTYTKLSKLSKMPDGKVYMAQSGALNVEKAFFRKGTYAAVSGTAELVIQPYKLGDTDDPNNKGDQPIGEPRTVKGTFTTKVTTAAYEG